MGCFVPLGELEPALANGASPLQLTGPVQLTYVIPDRE